jgi:hypothetical protein
MRNVIPLFVILLASVAAAALLLPADPWSQYQTIRVAVILLVAVPCYLIGTRHGRQRAEEVAGGAGKRQWFQFSLRTMLFVTLLLALWLGFHCERVRKQREAVRALEETECSVDYEDGPGASGDAYSDATWADSFFGNDFLHRAVYVSLEARGVEKALPHLKRLPHLQTVDVFEDTERRFSMFGQPPAEEELAARAAKQKAAIERLRKELPRVRVDEGRWPFMVDPA